MDMAQTGGGRKLLQGNDITHGKRVERRERWKRFVGFDVTSVPEETADN